jgi:hypothetical protein
MLHALPVAADVGTFTLTDRTEVRVRGPDPVTNAAALVLDTAADARATLASPHSLYTLAYQPRLTLLDMNGGPAFSPGLLNGWLASAGWTTGHALIELHETGGYGAYAFASLGTIPAPGTAVETNPGGQPTTVANTQLVPGVQTYTVLSSNTSASSTLTLKPWLVTGIVGYQLSGGADAPSRLFIPFGQGPYAQAIADLRAGRRDHLVTVGNALESSFVPIDTEVVLLEVQEQWRHAWTRNTDTMLAGGISEARTRDAADAPYEYATDGVAEGKIEQRFGRGKNVGAIDLDVRLAPVVNQLLGLVDERVQASLLASWTHRKVTLRASATAAESLDQSSPLAAKILTGEVDAEYSPNLALSFDVGARVLAEDQSYAATSATGVIGPVTETTFNQGVVFFAVTVRAVKTRF